MIRRSPIRRTRSKPRRGRLDAAGMAKLRKERYLFDDCHCVVCGNMVFMELPPEDDASMHLAHKKGKRMWGDSIQNTQTECGACHRAYHQNGPSRQKIVPSKRGL